MPKNTPVRRIDQKIRTTSGLLISATGGGVEGVTDHGALTGLADDDHTQYYNQARGDARYVRHARALTAGAGLTGGGDLSDDRDFAVGAGNGITVNANDVALASSTAGAGLTFSAGVLSVGAGNGITVNADDVALSTPGTLTVSTGNSASAHTHAITSSSNPGAAASLLASDASGFLALTKLRTPLIDTASGDLTLAPATDIELDPASNLVNLTSGVSLQSSNFASQTTGMRVTYAGEGDFRYLFADEMHVKTFIADLEQALAGGQIISKSVAVLSRAFTAPAAAGTATLYVWDLPSAENMAVFESGDIVRLREFSRATGTLTVTDCWGVVTSYSNLTGKEQSWTFTRSSGANAGAMATSTVIAADSLVLDYGVSGNGYYEVNAIDGAYGLNSPYAQVVTWTTHPHTGKTVNARYGALRGIFSVADEYGLYVGTGTADSNRFLRLSNAAARFNNIPIYMWNSGTNTGLWDSNGSLVIGADGIASADRDFTVEVASKFVRLGRTGSNKPNLLWDATAGTLSLRSNTTDVITMDSSGNSYFSGVMTIGTSGEVRQGTGTLGSNFTGLRIWRSSNVGLIGGYNNNTVQWQANTSGKLTAGAGTVILDENGIGITEGLAWNNNINAVRWLDGGGAVSTRIATWGASGTRISQWGFAAENVSIEMTESSTGSFMNIKADDGIQLLDVTTVLSDLLVNGNLSVGLNVSTADSVVKVGASRSGSGNSYIDLIGDTTYSTYGLRIIRANGGANTPSQIAHRGTGNFLITAQDAGALFLQTNNTSRVTVLSTGLVGVGTGTPTSQLHVFGNARAETLYASAENGGISGTTGLSNGTTATSTGNGTVKMAAGTARNSDIWIKFYVGTTVYHVPAWSNIN